MLKSHSVRESARTSRSQPREKEKRNPVLTFFKKHCKKKHKLLTDDVILPVDVVEHLPLVPVAPPHFVHADLGIGGGDDREIHALQTESCGQPKNENCDTPVFASMEIRDQVRFAVSVTQCLT